MNTVGNNFWTNKKKSGTIASYGPPIFNAAEKSYRPYYSSRRLKAYRFSMSFKAQPKTGGQTYTAVRTIDCN